MLQNSVPVASVAQVVWLDEPPGLPSARTNTEQVVVPVLVGSGLGSWKPALSSVQLLSRTWKSPCDKLI